jgi:hypothetical protein
MLLDHDWALSPTLSPVAAKVTHVNDICSSTSVSEHNIKCESAVAMMCFNETHEMANFPTVYSFDELHQLDIIRDDGSQTVTKLSDSWKHAFTNLGLDVAVLDDFIDSSISTRVHPMGCTTSGTKHQPGGDCDGWTNAVSGTFKIGRDVTEFRWKGGNASQCGQSPLNSNILCLCVPPGLTSVPTVTPTQAPVVPTMAPTPSPTAKVL